MKLVIVVAHVLIILLAYSSPFWLDWRIVVVGVGLYWLQNLIFHGCVLSQAQFKDNTTTFHEWYLAKLGIKPNHKRLKLFLDVWLPLFIILLAVVMQNTFLSPWLHV